MHMYTTVKWKSYTYPQCLYQPQKSLVVSCKMPTLLRHLVSVALESTDHIVDTPCVYIDSMHRLPQKSSCIVIAYYQTLTNISRSAKHCIWHIECSITGRTWAIGFRNQKIKKIALELNIVGASSRCIIRCKVWSDSIRTWARNNDSKIKGECYWFCHIGQVTWNIQ